VVLPFTFDLLKIWCTACYTACRTGLQQIKSRPVEENN